MTFDALRNSTKSGATNIEAPSPAQDEAFTIADVSQDRFKLAQTAVKPAETCAGNASFERLIDFAARNIYDPKALGDISELKSGHPCLKSEDEAIKLADKTLTEADRTASARPVEDNWDKYAVMGVGVTLKETTSGGDKSVAIDVVLPGGPADLKGLKRGDVITEINGVSVADKSLQKIAEELRGKQLEPVEVKVTRDGKEMEPVTAVRNLITIPNTTAKFGGTEVSPGGQILPDGVGYVRVENFYSTRVSSEIADFLNTPSGEPGGKTVAEASKGLIIDLRGNSGGDLKSIGMVSSLFMNEGEIAKIVSRVPGSDPSDPKYSETMMIVRDDENRSDKKSLIADMEHRFNASKDVDKIQALKNNQLFVLTDKATAGSAELFAEALRFNAGAKLIGTETRGHSMVTMANRIDGVTVTLPIGRLYTPSGWLGDSFRPDVHVSNPANTAYGSQNDLQLKTALDSIR